MKKKRMEGNSCGSGSGRSRRSEKDAEAAEIRKGPWRAEEDEVLVNHVNKHGPRDWSSLRSKGLLKRTGKSCRLRWVNKLRPNLKNGCKFSAEEETIVIELQAEFGNKWARIASFLPGRTDNDVKNFWSSRQKRLARILHAQASVNPSSSSASKREQRKKKETVPTLPHNFPSINNPKSCSADHRDDPSESKNHISDGSDRSLAQAHIFCPDFLNPQLGCFGVENHAFLPIIDDPNFELVNGGQFPTDAALFQASGGCLSSGMDEKIITESYTFMEHLPTDMSDRFEHLPSPSRW